MSQTKKYVRIVGENVIMVPACCVDDDLDIQANVNVVIDADVRRKRKALQCRVQISPDKIISYPGLVVAKTRIKSDLPFGEYDDFIRSNFDEVLDLIMSLLEPDELLRLSKKASQLRLF